MAPVKLPRYVMFKGDNGNNLCHWDNGSHPYVAFNSTNRDLWGSHEVVPLKNDVVRIKSLYNNGWWRLSPNWIWADEFNEPDENYLECLFKVIQLSPTKVVLQNLRNGNYVKRLTADGKTSCLNAAAEDHRNDVCTQLEVSEALSARRVFDVQYLMDQLQTTDMKPLVLGSTTAKNSTRYKSDVASTVTYEVSESYSWSNSVSIMTGLSVTVSAGIPAVADVSTTLSTEFTATTEMGKENGKSKTFSSTFTIKDVNPGEQVTVRVSGTRATGTVPYKYKYQDTRVDGLTMDEETGVDGIFKGVQVVDIKWEATTSSGARKDVVKTD